MDDCWVRMVHLSVAAKDERRASPTFATTPGRVAREFPPLHVAASERHRSDRCPLGSSCPREPRPETQVPTPSPFRVHVSHLLDRCTIAQKSFHRYDTPSLVEGDFVHETPHDEQTASS